MKRMRYIAAVLAMLLIGAFLLRYVRNQHDRMVALPVVAELGGTVGSIPFEPFGTEYRIVFRQRWFTNDEIEKLAILEPLARRNWVGIHFQDTNLSSKDIQHLQQLLPAAHISHGQGDR